MSGSAVLSADERPTLGAERDTMSTIDAIRARLKAYEAAEVAHRERALARANGIFTEGSAPDTADAVMDTLGELHENAPDDIPALLARVDALEAVLRDIALLPERSQLGKDAANLLIEDVGQRARLALREDTPDAR